MPWDPRKIDILERAWLADLPLDEITRRLSLEFSPSRVSRKAQELGLPPRRASWSAREIDILRLLWREGFAPAAIGRQLTPPRTADSVRKQAARLGLPATREATDAGSCAGSCPEREGLDEERFASAIRRAALGGGPGAVAAEAGLTVSAARRLLARNEALVAETRLRLNVVAARAGSDSTVAAVLRCLEAAGDTVRPPDPDAGELRWWLNWRHCALRDLVRRANTWRGAFGLPGFDAELVAKDFAAGTFAGAS